MNEHPRERLGAFADGELSPEETRRVAIHLESCTECARELAIIQRMGGVMRTMEPVRGKKSTWKIVRRRLAPTLGWSLVVAGGLFWCALALIAWFREAFTPEWLAGSAVGVGFLVLLVGIGWEQYLEWKDSPYRELER